MQQRPKHPLFSFIVPVYNEEGNVDLFLRSLYKELTELSINYEIIVVDDGSIDNTLNLIIELGKNISLKCIELSRNFGKEQALTAGLQHSSGDAAIIIDSDFQHPFELIPQFIKNWKEGYDMVYGIRRPLNDEGFLRKFLTKLFYKTFIKISQINIKHGAGDFRLIDRKIITALNNLPEHARFMKGLYFWVGFKSIGIPFFTKKRFAGKSTYNLRKLLNLASIGITSFSTVPLRISTYMGIFISIISFFYGFWIVIKTLLFGTELPGWSTLVSGMFFLGGIQLTVIGILGEYVGHIFTEVKNRPNYIVSQIHDFIKK